MIEKRQQALLREIADAQDNELRYRAVHYLIADYVPRTEAQMGALAAALAELTGATDLAPLESVVEACKLLKLAYVTGEGNESALYPVPNAARMGKVAEILGPHLIWDFTAKNNFFPNARDPLTAIAVSGVHTIIEGKSIIRCGYCNRHIVPKRSSAAWCGPSCKSGAQYRRNRDAQH